LSTFSVTVVDLKFSARAALRLRVASLTVASFAKHKGLWGLLVFLPGPVHCIWKRFE